MSSSPPRAGQHNADGPSAARPSVAKARRNRKLRRRFAGGMALLLGLVSAGFLAAALTPSPQVASADEDLTAQVREGKALYETSCITCHGANLQGVNDRGPSLIGVGEAAVYFQVSSGRMPMAAQRVRRPIASHRSSSRDRSTRSARTSRPTAAVRSFRATRTAESPASRCVAPTRPVQRAERQRRSR